MLIVFEAENYRSIKNRVSLQLTAQNYYKEARQSLIDVSLPGLRGTTLLRSAALYGPNASGKTTIYNALAAMRGMVVSRMANALPLASHYAPFKLDPACSGKPTAFFAAFVAEGVRFEYEFSFDASRIVAETLSAYPKGRKQLWFSRTVNGIDDSPYVSVPKSIMPLVNDNALLLSFLAMNPKLQGSQAVAPVYDWFSDRLRFLDRGPEAPSLIPHSGEILDGNYGTDFQRNYIRDMLFRADFGISGVRVEKERMSEEESNRFRSLASLLGDEYADAPFDVVKRMVFEHEGKGGRVSFSQVEESDGTLQLFSLSGYVAEALEMGSVLVVDELDKSLHPTVVREVIKCFQDSSLNVNGAQLIFTAHNPCLLEGGLLRRDQIWFTEKDLEGATLLFPLSDFSPRQNESISNGYLTGRYSAAPIVPECFGLSCANPSLGAQDGQ